MPTSLGRIKWSVVGICVMLTILGASGRTFAIINAASKVTHDGGAKTRQLMSDGWSVDVVATTPHADIEAMRGFLKTDNQPKTQERSQYEQSVRSNYERYVETLVARMLRGLSREVVKEIDEEFKGTLQKSVWTALLETDLQPVSIRLKSGNQQLEIKVGTVDFTTTYHDVVRNKTGSHSAKSGSNIVQRTTKGYIAHRIITK